MDKLKTAQQKLEDLRNTFRQELPNRIQAIVNLIAVYQEKGEKDVLDELQLRFHSLAGSAGTFGASVISNIARSAETCIIESKSIKERGDIVEKLQEHSSLLEQAEKNWFPSQNQFELQPAETGKWNNYVYLVEDDLLLKEELLQKLEATGYRVRTFASPDEIIFEEKKPSIIIMDMIFQEGEVTGAEAISQLKAKIVPFPSVIFVSVRRDIEAKLAAVRAGGVRYFEKPLEMEKLVQTLDGLSSKNIRDPYRVMIVDDDVALGLFYTIVLKEAGMDVKHISNPLTCLSVLEEFSPELILMDVHMPECSGLELASVIRQDDKWAKTPIVFLSTETQLDKQLAAMHLGGDDFLTKPLDSHHLVQSLNARLKRARWINQLDDKLNRALRESEFQNITLNKHAVVSESNEQGVINFVNDKLCQISGYNKSELIGKDHKILNSGLHTESYFEEMWRTISRGRVWHGILRNKSKTGVFFWLDMTIVPFLSTDGVPYKYVSASTDVTELMESQARVQKAEKKLRTIFDNMQDVIFRIDEQGIIAMISPSVELLFGEAAHDLVGSNFYELIGESVYTDLLNNLDLQGGKIRDYEFTKNNSAIAVTCRRNTKEDEFLGVEGVMRDITEKKALESKLQIERDNAEKANLAKSQFLSSMSHELRTPLNAILGFAQLIEMNETSMDIYNSASEIVGAGQHLLELIDEVLDLAKIEAGKVDLSNEEINIRELIFECSGYLSAKAEKNSIKVEIGGDASTNVIYGDPRRLRQILLNLLSNAIKYNKRYGQVLVDYSINQERLRIDVKDTGIGIAERDIERLFRPFERLQSKCDEEGTGIGLVVTKTLINLMGGKLHVESNEGVGSHFWFELPRIMEPSRKDSKKEYQVPKELEKKATWKVLYVEDNYANLRLIEKLLKKRGDIKLSCAVDAEQAFAILEEEWFDLILLDINLPDLSGYEILEILRAKYKIDNTPVIAISANAMQKDIERGEAVFDAYITKPINVKRFLELVNSVLT